ncbi:MAG: VWA domain-containing protein [Ferruginibacter sp.]|nr:VWA domain-containing protein [Ferruginibacter sp.]
MPQFQYTLFLILLILVPVTLFMYLYARRKKKRTIKKIGDPELVNQLMGRYNYRGFFLKFLLVSFAMALLVLALANLRLPKGTEKINRTGIDVMIAIDVSKSMLAQDIKPTRLDRAKQLLSRLIDKLGNDRIGIVIFAGKAYLQMPLTGDHTAAKMYLSSASTESVPTQGTVIGDALKMCYASFNTKEKKYKAVLLISDGEDHDETAVQTAGQMASEGIVINTIGIGSPEGAPIMDAETGQMKTDAEGNTVISKLNEEALKSIAQKGNGIYMLYNNTEEVASNLAAQLATMDQRTVNDDSLINYKSFYQWFLALALLFLLIELFIREMKKTKSLKIKTPAAAVILVMLCLPALAQTEKEIIKQGNDAYNKKDYPAAANEYNKVLVKNSENSTAQYNLGNALYKSEKPDDAITAYDKSIVRLAKPVEKSNAWYNKGVVLHNDKKLPECIAAYKNALKLDPKNEDARQNLQKALQQQKEKEQKDKNEKNKDQDKQQNKNNQSEPKPKPSRISKKDAEEKLKALMQKEKNLQDKLHKINVAAPDKPEKDW